LVACHDSHVIYVIEHFHIVKTDFLHYGQSLYWRGQEISRVVNFSIEWFQID
jgi:hypothetical protein